MKVPYSTLLLTALIGVAGMAQAQSTGLTRSAIETAYAEFERIEIAFGPTQVKVEAIDAQTGQAVEAIYDRATGAILKQETGSVAGSIGTGIEVRNRTEDFVRLRASDDATQGLDRAFDDNPRGSDSRGSDDDGIDDTTGGDDSDGSASRSGSDDSDDKGRGRGRSDRQSGGGSDDGGSDSSGSDDGGSDDDNSGGDDD